MPASNTMTPFPSDTSHFVISLPEYSVAMPANERFDFRPYARRHLNVANNSNQTFDEDEHEKDDGNWNQSI